MIEKLLSASLLCLVLAPFAHSQSIEDLELRRQIHEANLNGNHWSSRASSLVITTTNSASLAEAIATTIFGGCVQISNISWSGSVYAFGSFSDPAGLTGINEGLVMSTGHVTDIPGAASNFSSTSIGTSGDSILSSLSQTSTYDAAILEFDFIPVSDTIFASEFAFGSEEYPEFVNAGFNDAFAFLVSGGPGNIQPTNVALIPNTSIPITIDNVNASSNSSYYLNNSSSADIVFDGMTTLIPLQYPVQENGTYHFKIGIADAGDASYDSGIFIKAQSFCGNFWLQSTEFVMMPQGGLTYAFENHSIRSSSYLWDFGDGNTSTDANPTHTYAQSGNYTVTLTGYNSCQENSSVQQLNTSITDVESPTETELKVYAVENGIRIDYRSDVSADLRYEVLNRLGQLEATGRIGITNSYNATIPLNIHSNGVYFLRLWAGDRPMTKRLTILNH